MKGGEASQEFVLSRHLGVRLGITPRLNQLVDSDRIRLCSFMVPMLPCGVQLRLLARHLSKKGMMNDTVDCRLSAGLLCHCRARNIQAAVTRPAVELHVGTQRA